MPDRSATIVSGPLSSEFPLRTLLIGPSGGRRPYATVRSLRLALERGLVAADGMCLPFTVRVGQATHRRILKDDTRQISQTDSHRKLKIHAKVIARSVLPDANISVESPLPGVNEFRPDLVAFTAEILICIEVGTIDGRLVLRQIQSGADYVVVLPYAHMRQGKVVALIFRKSGTPPLPLPTPRELRRAFNTLGIFPKKDA